jgi:hypothetical protein
MSQGGEGSENGEIWVTFREMVMVSIIRMVSLNEYAAKKN